MIFEASYPFSPRCGLVLRYFWAQKGPILEASSLEVAELAASEAPFCHPTFRSWNFHRLEVGGRQLLPFGSFRGAIWTQICRFGTHGRHFGPVASSELPVWQRPAHFRSTPHEFGASRGHFRASDLETPELHGLRPRGRQLWRWPSDFSLETGPKLTFGTHDRPSLTRPARICITHDISEASDVQYPVIAGVLGPPLENQHKFLLVRVPPLQHFFTRRARGFEKAKPSVFNVLGFSNPPGGPKNGWIFDQTQDLGPWF